MTRVLRAMLTLVYVLDASVAALAEGGADETHYRIYWQNKETKRDVVLSTIGDKLYFYQWRDARPDDVLSDEVLGTKYTQYFSHQTVEGGEKLFPYKEEDPYSKKPDEDLDFGTLLIDFSLKPPAVICGLKDGASAAWKLHPAEQKGTYYLETTDGAGKSWWLSVAAKPMLKSLGSGKVGEYRAPVLAEQRLEAFRIYKTELLPPGFWARGTYENRPFCISWPTDARRPHMLTLVGRKLYLLAANSRQREPDDVVLDSGLGMDHTFHFGRTKSKDGDTFHPVNRRTKGSGIVVFDFGASSPTVTVGLPKSERWVCRIHAVESKEEKERIHMSLVDEAGKTWWLVVAPEHYVRTFTNTDKVLEYRKIILSDERKEIFLLSQVDN